LQELKTAFAVG